LGGRPAAAIIGAAAAAAVKRRGLGWQLAGRKKEVRKSGGKLDLDHHFIRSQKVLKMGWSPNIFANFPSREENNVDFAKIETIYRIFISYKLNLICKKNF
jgi:hypothetical protein